MSYTSSTAMTLDLDVRGESVSGVDTIEFGWNRYGVIEIREPRSASKVRRQLTWRRNADRLGLKKWQIEHQNMTERLGSTFMRA